MRKVRLGRTELEVSKTSFGALPIQRVSFDEAARLLRRAYDAGVNFFDTANAYTDSEEKIGYALSDVRDKIIIATKSGVTNLNFIRENLDKSLRRMKTDYIDIYQLHNPAKLPSDDVYEFLLRAKEAGKVRHIGITNHRPGIAREAVESGLFETLQFPFSLLSGEKEEEIVRLCAEKDVGFIAMKAISGGLISNARAAFTFLDQFPNVVPIYGVQRMEELEEWLALENNPPKYTDEIRADIEKQRAELGADFCRGCGYCMPCPAGIEIWTAARMSLLIGRAPYEDYLSDTWRDKMNLIENCIGCGNCTSHCPYGLDTPSLLKRELFRYRELYQKLR